MLYLIVIIYCIIYYKPNIDVTKEKEVLLWYGRENRKYIKLF